MPISSPISRVPARSPSLRPVSSSTIASAAPRRLSAKACSSRIAAIPHEVATYIAESGEIVEKNGNSTCCSSRAAPSARAASAIRSLVTFEDYAIDLSQFIHPGDGVLRPREREHMVDAVRD